MSNRGEPPYTPELQALLKDLEEGAAANAKDWCPSCGAHWPRDEEERAAVVKHLRKLARATKYDAFATAFNIAADHIEADCHHDIERGEHVGS